MLVTKRGSKPQNSFAKELPRGSFLNKSFARFLLLTGSTSLLETGCGNAGYSWFSVSTWVVSIWPKLPRRIAARIWSLYSSSLLFPLFFFPLFSVGIHCFYKQNGQIGTACLGTLLLQCLVLGGQSLQTVGKKTPIQGTQTFTCVRSRTDAIRLFRVKSSSPGSPLLGASVCKTSLEHKSATKPDFPISPCHFAPAWHRCSVLGEVQSSTGSDLWSFLK